MLFCPYGTAFSLLFFVSKACLLDVLDFRSLYRSLSFYAQFRLGVLSQPSMCLNDFHSGLLSKGPEEPADRDRARHLRVGTGGEPTHQNKPQGEGGLAAPRAGFGRSRLSASSVQGSGEAEACELWNSSELAGMGFSSKVEPP